MKINKSTNSKTKSFALWSSVLMLFVITSIQTFAQSIPITGTVSDTNETLPGVNVVIKGTTIGTVTDVNGKYNLNVPNENSVLQFLYVGYSSQEVTVGNQRTINIVLREDAHFLEEVVVIGYGTKRKGDITTAVSVVDMSNVGSIPGMDASRYLQGQAAGVHVKQISGTPGQEMEITVRGLTSIGTGMAPLYVVDGFPMGQSMNQSINPNDIESISILKDAASTAIYGARGSNGVVLITTKRAKEGDVSLTATASYGIQNIPQSRRTKMMNGPEFARFLNESWVDRYKMNNNGREPTTDQIPIDFRHPELTKYSTDWFNEIVNNNQAYQNYNVTLSSGSGKVKSVLSVGYQKQDGAIIETVFERYNVRANIEGKVNNNLTVGWNIAGIRTNENAFDTNGRNNIIGAALWADPRDPVYKEDGSWNAYIGGHDGIFGSYNPVMYAKEYSRKIYRNRILTNGYVEISFLKDFKFKPSVNISLNDWSRTDFSPSTLAGQNAPPPRNASMAEYEDKTVNYNTDILLTYAKKIGEHSINALLGYTIQEETYNRMYASVNRFPNDDIRVLQNAQTVSTISNTIWEWSLLAYLARVDYSFKDKYLLSASIRREGSSRFGKDTKWGDFPSVSLGWKVSEESFVKDINWLNTLKLRASYGLTGNNDIGNYSSLSGMNTGNYILGNNYAAGVVLQAFANAQLGWEKSQSLDLGLDLGLFENKLIFTAEFYNKLTTSMLLSKDIPIITGFSTTQSNMGEVRNRGVELSLDYRTAVIRDLNVRGNFNISFNRNKILALRGENDIIENFDMYNMYSVHKVGQPMSMIYGYKVLGIFQNQQEIDNSPKQDGAIPGVYKMWDADGNGEITYDQKDMVEIANPHPKFVWAFTLAADYKHFDLNILFTGAQKYDVYRNIEATTTNMDGVFNVLKDAENRFRSPESPGKGKIPTTNTWKWEREVSSRYVYDASHAWIKSITIGYKIPAKSTSIIRGARFYLNAENMFLITKFPGNNPDVNLNNNNRIGRDDESYPVPRIFTIGTEITF